MSWRRIKTDPPEDTEFYGYDLFYGGVHRCYLDDRGRLRTTDGPSDAHIVLWHPLVDYPTVRQIEEARNG